jgi:DMSO/TMAO reductase YedYZ molybdopterin-dependent catalytic subunit
VPRGGTARPGARTGAISGLITAAVAMGIAQLIAGLTTPQASPVVDVGQAVIGGTPLPVKDWATATFGTNDKTFLVGGVLILLFAFAAVIGVIAARRLENGLAGLGVFAIIGLAAVLTRPDATGSWIWPTLLGAAAGAVALWLLVKNATQAVAEEQAAREEAARQARKALAKKTPPAKNAPSKNAPSKNAPSKNAPSKNAPAKKTPAAETGWIAGSTPARDVPGTQPNAAPRDWEAVPGWMLRTGAQGNGRRAFLWTAGLSLAAAAAGEYGGQQLATRHNVTVAQQAIRFPRPAVTAPPLPAGINPKVAGLSSFITPNGNFYRVYTALVLPQVDPKGWTLRIHGMVAREVTITFDQLLRQPLIEDYITLCCVSNPVSGPYIGNAKWLGASLATLLRQAGPQAGADQLLCTSVDGFTSGTPLSVVMDGRDALVAVAMNGTALPVAHGFPARLVVPGLYGYVSATKWVTDIEVTTFDKAAAYWVQNGWSQQAPIKTESRIDVPSSGATVGPGPVTIAGVAWAQHKGIAAVEVQVDKGPWQEATLVPVPDLDTWRQWTWDWAAPAPGNHTIQARATDKTGYTQTSLVADVAPNGASGYPSAMVTVKQS